MVRDYDIGCVQYGTVAQQLSPIDYARTGRVASASWAFGIKKAPGETRLGRQVRTFDEGKEVR
jgi:hypothetical protein